VDNAVKPRRAARSCRDDASIEALSENLLAAMCLLTPEPTSDEVKANAAARTGQIRHASNVSAVDATGCDIAERARRCSRHSLSRNQDRVIPWRDVLDGQARRDQGREVELPAHVADLADESATLDQRTSSNVSQTQICTPIHKRTRNIRYRPPNEASRDQHWAREPMVAQRFIQTGSYACHYRVLTLFGEPLVARFDRSTIPLPPLNSSDEVLAGATIASSFPHRTSRFAREPDVLDLARRTYYAAPDIPLQGVDIIREDGTDKLYVLEINPGGNTWIFSNKWSANFKASVGVDDVATAFDSWDVAARVLVERTRTQAL
jgi:hypothetical protein